MAIEYARAKSLCSVPSRPPLAFLIKPGKKRDATQSEKFEARRSN